MEYEEERGMSFFVLLQTTRSACVHMRPKHVSKEEESDGKEGGSDEKADRKKDFKHILPAAAVPRFVS